MTISVVSAEVCRSSEKWRSMPHAHAHYAPSRSHGRSPSLSFIALAAARKAVAYSKSLSVRCFLRAREHLRRPARKREEVLRVPLEQSTSRVARHATLAEHCARRDLGELCGAISRPHSTNSGTGRSCGRFGRSWRHAAVVAGHGRQCSGSRRECPYLRERAQTSRARRY